MHTVMSCRNYRVPSTNILFLVMMASVYFAVSIGNLVESLLVAASSSMNYPMTWIAWLVWILVYINHALMVKSLALGRN